jgi:hypothetical protein
MPKKFRQILFNTLNHNIIFDVIELKFNLWNRMGPKSDRLPAARRYVQVDARPCSRLVTATARPFRSPWKEEEKQLKPRDE